MGLTRRAIRTENLVTVWQINCLNLIDAQFPVAIHYNGYGDRLLCLPALRALASLFPNRIKLICGVRDRDTFFADLPLADIIELKYERDVGGWLFDHEAAAKAVGDCDLLISLNTWYSASISRLQRSFASADSIGLYSKFSRRVAWDPERHAADRVFEIARQIKSSLNIEQFSQPLELPRSEVENARFIRSRIPRHRRVLAVHTRTTPEKMWSPGKFTSVIDEFLDRHPDYVVFVFDQERYGLDSGKHGNRVFPLPCWQIPLARSFAILSETDLFLGIDSCMLHLADLYRIPGVGLFGPTKPSEFGFRFGPHKHIQSGQSMEDISESEVLSALDELVELSERKRAEKLERHAY